MDTNRSSSKYDFPLVFKKYKLFSFISKLYSVKQICAWLEANTILSCWKQFNAPPKTILRFVRNTHFVWKQNKCSVQDGKIIPWIKISHNQQSLPHMGSKIIREANVASYGHKIEKFFKQFYAQYKEA